MELKKLFAVKSEDGFRSTWQLSLKVWDKHVQFYTELRAWNITLAQWLGSVIWCVIYAVIEENPLNE